ncbi:hypothetical protein EPUL_002585 [Erysiphe pulchra]|uniref:TECPR1-like DysF domain-containing protein n=1 Tax=Erysiphe pulchra TaxID=225359 RepID=A0A2S4Q0I2_9PEZI|nr:hypothetical protein EPUL_002585 [Erysiphe pulchra]
MENSLNSESIDISTRDQIEANNTSFSENQGLLDTQQHQHQLDDKEVPLTTGSNGNDGQISERLAENRLLVAPENFVSNKRVKVDGFLNQLIAKNKILGPSEIREVEIFELQLLSSAGEWVPFLYGRSPFISSFGSGTEPDRPKGTRFLEDVQPPYSWEWTDEKWTLDFSSHEWVEERVITGVEVEIEGERWVYDVRYENDMKDTSNEKGKQIILSTWEGGINNSANMEKRRGEWRRRRWFRTVKRKWP